jgi:4-hydroxy-tetrahydrodipicolinate synthase
MASNLGVDGIMIVTPYYSKPSQYGIMKHFEEVSKATDLPVMAYNIPGRTSKLMELSTLEKLVDDVGIHSIKDAVGDLRFSTEEINLLNDKCHIYCGNDNETIEFMKMGAKGVISVASHIVGKQIKNILTSVIDGNISNAEDIHSNLLELFEALFLEPSPGPVKYLLTQSWEDVGNPLLPITSVSPKFMGELDNIFKKIK